LRLHARLFHDKRFHRTEFDAFAAFDADIHVNRRRVEPVLGKRTHRADRDRWAGMILRAAGRFYDEFFIIYLFIHYQ
jgi:hypothetical protein